jgi:hypothetical protein
VISCFRRDADEIRTLLGYHAALNGASVTDVSEKHIGPIFKDQEAWIS